MDQFEELLKLLRTISDYLDKGMIGCEQVPVDDILYIIQQEYERAEIDAVNAKEVYQKLIYDCIGRNDRKGLSYPVRDHRLRQRAADTPVHGGSRTAR